MERVESELIVLDTSRKTPRLEPVGGETPADGLVRCGWWVAAHAVSGELVSVLVDDLAALREADRLQRAGVGRERDFLVDEQVRGDRIFWLSRQRMAQARFLDEMEQLRLALNRDLFLGLFEFEAHYALYPPGAFYQRHYDSLRGAANRIVSVVCYLNPDWQPGDGGELVLYPDRSGDGPVSIAPRAGTLVLFLSEEIPHEVRVAHKPRASIAGWFRLNSSIGGQVDPAH